ncbi:MAG TPA: SGNH/GDSL hydrolase family protein [Verrucomicrobiae bacterium]
MSGKKFFAALLIFVLSCFTLLPTSARAANSPIPSKAKKLLKGVHRIVFLGDSITQAGDYVVDCECWMLAHGIQVQVLNLGLASETASDLTPEQNAGHLKSFGFPRPALNERLGRALAATKPDLVFACYGMNDAGSLPPDASGTQAFADSIIKLRNAAKKAGVKRIVICTPPVFDDKGDRRQSTQDENLERYTAWLLSKRADGWNVVDIHTPMRQALDEARAKDPRFQFAGDGVHPGREGHWLMAREILSQAFGAKLDGVHSSEDLFPAHGTEIRKLVQKRSVILFDAWMSQIGHKRPGVPGGPDAKHGLTVAEAQKQAGELGIQISRESSGK